MRSLLFIVFITVFVAGSNADAGSLDMLAEDSAFKTVVQLRPRTGALNQAVLPAIFSGMKVSVVRLRSGTLWRKGSNASGFSIPPRTVTVPHVKRLLIVYHDLGNWSNRYYASRLTDYSLATSVVGFAVYNSSDAKPISTVPVDLDTRGKSILVGFPDTITKTYGGRCLLIRRDGTTSVTDIVWPNTCRSEDQGKFAIIVPKEKRGGRRHGPWAIGIAVGSIGTSSVMSCFLGWLLVRRCDKLRKAKVMKRGTTDEDEMFASIWVADTKMPYAIVTRTQPVLEN